MNNIQNQIAGYASGAQAVRNRATEEANKFDSDFNTKVTETNRKLESVARGLEGAGASVATTKLIMKGVKYVGGKIAGSGRSAANATGESAATDPGTAAATSNPAQAAADGNAGDAGSASGGAGGATSAPDSTGGGSAATGSSTGADTQGGLGGADDDGGSLQTPRTINQSSTTTDAAAEGPTLEGAPDSALEAIAGDTADISSGVADTAATVISGAVEGATTAATALSAVAAPVLDVLGPLGLLAGIGMSLYEAFHHAPKPPPPPIDHGLQRQKGELVLPTTDGVQDTPASSSAF